ncbi:transposase-like protein DUF772 [Pseudofulvimonas gallinarii]|uniref:Transposase-like protein DUF772 n=1 Tax=Pseudofulvimonas gallinarii TaxID=634155 RepID=A0A4R3LE60_9GAMM|nr:transposase-like protein DUF772 [Pseudofulvimonas gallinarii]
MQLTFGDAEDLSQRKQARREIFLAQMDHVVPWQTLLKLITPHYPTLGRPGRQPYALATMLRIHFLQQWYALSDPAMEEALHDTPVMRRFAQLGGLDAVPDETTILNFRRLLETHDLATKMLSKVNAHLSRAGLSLRAGTHRGCDDHRGTDVDQEQRWRTRPGNAPDEEGQAVVLRDEGAHWRG